VWSAADFDGKLIANSAKDAAELTLPEGTRVVDDPEVGKALALDHSSMIKLSRTASSTTSSPFPSSSRAIRTARCSAMAMRTPGSSPASKAATSTPAAVASGPWHRARVARSRTVPGTGSPQLMAASLCARSAFTWMASQGEGRSSRAVPHQRVGIPPRLHRLLGEIRLYQRILSADAIESLRRRIPQP
jgi:hypothetical protein